MHWRRGLIDWPVRLFNLWWSAYAVVLTVLFMVVVTVTLIAVVLDLVFGVRWGW